MSTEGAGVPTPAAAVTCEACKREIAPRSDGRPRAHKPRKGALNNCPGGERASVPTTPTRAELTRMLRVLSKVHRSAEADVRAAEAKVARVEALADEWESEEVPWLPGPLEAAALRAALEGTR